jgi:type I restriction enzyme S subunit
MTRPDQFTDETPVSFVPMAAVDDVTGAIVKAQTRQIGDVWRGYKRFAENDVIFAKITPCMENGKCAVAKGLLNGLGLGSTEFHVLRPNSAVTAQWIYHFVRQESFRADAASEMSGAVGQQRVPTDYMKAAPIPLAPLPEQRRIVAEIETQFTRLEAGVTALKRAQANLRRYKASVLKAACEGRLVPTEAELARAEGRDYEPADVLLERILAERRAKWEAENPGKKYKEPNPPDTSELPELPEGWTWIAWEQVIRLSQNGLSKRRSETGDPTVVLRLADIVGGSSISLQDPRRIKLVASEIEKFELLGGDMLCIRVNGSPDLVGRMILFGAANEPIAFCDHFIRFRPVLPETAPLLALNFDTERVRRYVDINKVSSAGQNTVSQVTMKAISLPLPPLAEQHRIVAEVERRLSVVQELEKQVELALRRAERLRQAILKHAFEGKLVPQDPSDEPASVLLQRIRAERDPQPTDEGKSKQPRQMRLQGM